jgi:hypothetical protein
MKNLPMTLNLRDRERGAVAIVIGVMWTALFGLAVMAVDFGYLYTKKRNLQSVADAVLRGTMPLYASNGQNDQTPQIRQRARDIADLSGYRDDGGATTTVRLTGTGPGPSSQLEVTIGRKHPTFFGGVFGLTPRQIQASAVGQVTATGSGAVIQALASAPCLAPVWGAGFFAQGNTSLTINGDVESNSQIVLQPASGSITGSVKTDCLTPLAGGFNPNGVTIAGGQNTILMGTITDSIAASPASLDTFCTPGTSVFAPMGIAIGWTNTGGPAGCDTPDDKVYCSSGNINIAPPTSLSICPGSKATFIAQGQITFGANDSIQLQPATGAPKSLVAASFGNMGIASCSGGFDVFMGSAGTYVLQGNVYAPNGCIAFGGAGGVGGFQMTGQMVGKNLDIQMSPGQPWVFTAPGGGGGGGSWKTVR